MKLFYLLILFVVSSLFSCESSAPSQKESKPSDQTQHYETINLYTYRYFTTDQELFERLGEQYHIKVEVFKAKGSDILDRLEAEKENPQADLVILENVGLLEEAKERGLLQAFASGTTDESVPVKYRDDENYWISLAKEVNCLAYNIENVKPTELLKIADLAKPKWKGQLALCNEDDRLNMLFANILLSEGERKTKQLVNGLKKNTTDSLYNSEINIIEAIASGEKQVGLLSSSAFIKYKMDGNPEHFQNGEKIGLVFPMNNQGRTYVNTSGVGVVKNSKKWQMALTLIEFLSSEQYQGQFANAIRAYPVNPMVIPGDFLISLGGFRESDQKLSQVAKQYSKAEMLMDEVNWK
ncbi:MAG: extracellular solute-binding protein [Saprospiraceae bacterium]|nr:extracellular solute-binding protein [Saprospiraceae bacterium]